MDADDRFDGDRSREQYTVRRPVDGEPGGAEADRVDEEQQVDVRPLADGRVDARREVDVGALAGVDAAGGDRLGGGEGGAVEDRCIFQVFRPARFDGVGVDDGGRVPLDGTNPVPIDFETLFVVLGDGGVEEVAAHTEEAKDVGDRRETLGIEGEALFHGAMPEEPGEPLRRGLDRGRVHGVKYARAPPRGEFAIGRELSGSPIVPLVDLETLRALVAFADADCNLTRAGEALGLSQPAVHGRLAAAGNSFGKPLYERRGRSLALTDAGRSVLGWALDVVAGETRVRAAVSGVASEEQIVVACGEGALVHLVAPRLAPFAREAPGVLAFRVLGRAAALASVAEGRAHLAVTVASVTDGAAPLASRVLLQSSLVALFSSKGMRRLPLREPPTIAAADLLDHALVLPPRGRPLREQFEGLAGLHRKPLRVAVDVTGWEAVVRLSELGVGIGIVNDFVETPALERKAIVGTTRVTYAAFHRPGRSSPLLARVLALLTGGPPLPSPRARGRSAAGR